MNVLSIINLSNENAHAYMMHVTYHKFVDNAAR